MPRLSKIGAAALAAFGWTSGSTVTASYLQVAGGGGGGCFGGGGAGGYLTGTTSLSLASSYTVTVGAGGAGVVSGASGGGANGVNGSNSQFGTLTASVGGGAGGGYITNVNGSTGGSGGGGGYFGSAGSATSGQGSAGGTGSVGGAGGGGAGAAGSNGGGSGSAGVGGAGGNGTASSISGSSVTYAGGGGGGNGDARTGGSGGAGGTGGGGAGSTGAGTTGASGTANLGGGGGGGGSGGGTNYGGGGQGGSGVVIISYVGAQQFGGGVVTSSGGNTIHTFTTSGTLSPLSSLTASYLIVAGGGGGGKRIAGAGGAGGYRTGSGVIIDTNSIYVVTVGAGGAGGAVYTVAGSSGSDSVFNAITSTGGGGGAGSSISNGVSGGSGGGSSDNGTAGSGNTPSTSPSQGNNGGVGSGTASGYGGGGGGGAGAVGGNGSSTVAGNGGAGTASSISGSSVTYAGGGGGGSNGGTAGTGGSGGGGAGTNSDTTATAGTANLGGGGGGCGGLSTSSGTTFGGQGGSGVVIISYAGSTQQMAGGTVTVAGGNVIHTFTSSGYLAPIFNANNSLRFRSSASAYLNRTFTNEQGTYTLSLWVKRGTLGVQQEIANSRTSGAGSTSYIEFNSSDQINIQLNGTSVLTTTAVYRDPASWYQIILSVTASATSYLYVNGTQIGSWTAGSNPFLFSNGAGYVCAIGRQGNLSAQYFDGYMAEVNYIDGQALTPNSFGYYSDLGVWQPIRYGGSYGTNGFYLPFTNTTSTTTLGYDFSPNGNNWTTNNISLTAGSTYDSMTDVPTNTSATVANYCTLNPIAPNATYVVGTVQAGNLDKVAGGANNEVQGTFGVTSGKWYFEYSFTTNATRVGIATGGPGKSAIATKGVLYENSTGNKIIDGTSTAYGATFNQTNVIGVALNADTNSVTFYKDNVSQGSISFTPTDVISPSIFTPNGVTITAHFNAGQRPFAYTPPTGFVALNTFNLPTPTIGATAATTANKYMDVTTYTGNGTAGRVITMSNMTNVGFAWVKIRSGADDHRLANTVTGGNKHLKSNATDAESTSTNIIQAFSSNTFTIGSDTGVNANSSTYVGWVWANDGTSGSTNTAGSITSTVSANTTAGFSIVTYTGNGTAGATIGHGLGVAPSMIIVKRRDNGSGGTNWFVYNKYLNNGTTPEQFYLILQSTNGQGGASNIWNDTAPTSTVFSVGTSVETNGSTGTFVAYCFAPIAGYSAFGSYTGNGSTDGPFVFTGFRPRFIMWKNTNATSQWRMHDTSRSPYNASVNSLRANGANAEDTSGAGDTIDFLSNGYKVRAAGTDINDSGNVYIYMVFAESPFKYANAR